MRPHLLASSRWHDLAYHCFIFTYLRVCVLTSYFEVEGALRRPLRPVWAPLAYCCDEDPPGLPLSARVPLP